MLDTYDHFPIIGSSILRYTYGIKVWKSGEGFLFKCVERMEDDGAVKLAKRGEEVRINEEFSVKVRPSRPFQSTEIFEIYYTRNIDARTCDEPGMRLLGKLKIDWSEDKNLGMERSITFKLSFGKMKIKATAYNEVNGQTYQTTFDIIVHKEFKIKWEQNCIKVKQEFESKLINLEKEIKYYKQCCDELGLQKQNMVQEFVKEKENYRKTIDSLGQALQQARELEEQNAKLREEASKYQSALGVVTNTRLGYDDLVKLKEDILNLQKSLENYVTHLKPNIDIVIEKV